ncbi:hypothetical protein EDC04DRAFT_444586 [Pisolithus marmoratus]|nr:hypothetical protein EDC04DRAFT_444586 [Pisolithus marmoratus]
MDMQRELPYSALFANALTESPTWTASIYQGVPCTHGECHLNHARIPQQERAGSSSWNLPASLSEYGQQASSHLIAPAQASAMYSGPNDVEDHAPPVSLLLGRNGCDVPFIPPAQAHARDGERGVQITSPSEGCTGAVNSVGFSPCQKGTVSDPQDNATRVSSTEAYMPNQMSGAPSCVGQDARLNFGVPPYPASHTGLDGCSSLVHPVPPLPHSVYPPVSGTYETAVMDVPRWDETPSRDSFYPVAYQSPLQSLLSDVSLLSSQSLYERMINRDVSNAYPSGVNLTDMPTSFLARTTCQASRADNHERMCRDGSESGRNVDLAVPSSLPLNTALLWQQRLPLSTADNLYSGGRPSMLVESPMADHSPVVIPNSSPTAHLFRSHIAGQRCGWTDDDGTVCGNLIMLDDVASHFATAHGIKNMASDKKVECRWCPPSSRKHVKRESMVRHLREVHLKCPRQKKGATRFFSQF